MALDTPVNEATADVPVIPRIVSVDDHVIEPPGVWIDRLPAQHREAAPHVERRTIGKVVYRDGGFVTLEGDGVETDCWIYGDVVKPIRSNIASAGLERDAMGLDPIDYDTMRKGCWEPVARLADMDLNHVEASLSFPSFPRFCGQEFLEAPDKDLSLLCVRAYNDWMVEEWSATDPSRLIPLCIIPLWDVDLAVEEIRRNAARGVRAVTFSEIPFLLGLPSIHDKNGYWDPFFRVCEETGTVVCMHIGSSSSMQTMSPDAPPAVNIALSFNNAMNSMSDYLFSGVLVRFPRLKLAYSEGQIGWIPYILERVDVVWEQHRGWSGVGKDSIPEPPSTYYYRNMYGCFFSDFHGLKSLDEVGVDNVTFETDYPHTDSSWPDTLALAERLFVGIDNDVVRKIVRGNAISMLGLDLEP